MKKAIVITLAAFIAVVFAACSGGTTKEQMKDTTAAMPADSSAGKMMAAVKYTCTMHPEVISDTPGKCPKCGMDLVKKEDSKDSAMKMGKDTMKH